MGCYINSIRRRSDRKSVEDGELPARGKAKAILEGIPGATLIPRPTEWQPDLVCVVENGFFDAAAYAFSKEEMDAFLHPDGRPRRWLIVPNAELYTDRECK